MGRPVFTTTVSAFPRCNWHQFDIFAGAARSFAAPTYSVIRLLVVFVTFAVSEQTLVPLTQEIKELSGVGKRGGELGEKVGHHSGQLSCSYPGTCAQWTTPGDGMAIQQIAICRKLLEKRPLFADGDSILFAEPVYDTNGAFRSALTETRFVSQLMTQSAGIEKSSLQEVDFASPPGTREAGNRILRLVTEWDRPARWQFGENADKPRPAGAAGASRIKPRTPFLSAGTSQDDHFKFVGSKMNVFQGKRVDRSSLALLGSNPLLIG